MSRLHTKVLILPGMVSVALSMGWSSPPGFILRYRDFPETLRYSHRLEECTEDPSSEAGPMNTVLRKTLRMTKQPVAGDVLQVELRLDSLTVETGGEHQLVPVEGGSVTYLMDTSGYKKGGSDGILEGELSFPRCAVSPGAVWEGNTRTAGDVEIPLEVEHRFLRLEETGTHRMAVIESTTRFAHRHDSLNLTITGNWNSCSWFDIDRGLVTRVQAECSTRFQVEGTRGDSPTSWAARTTSRLVLDEGDGADPSSKSHAPAPSSHPGVGP